METLEKIKELTELLSVDATKFFKGNKNKKIAIEVQGRQHTGFVKFFHENRMNFLHQLNRDKKKERFCELNKITLVTIFENDTINKELFESQGVTL